MADATLRSAVMLHARQGKKFERAQASLDSTYAVPSGTVVGTKIYFATIPTDARIHGDSFIVWDALGTSVTLNVGFEGKDGQFTAAPTALFSALAVATASTANTRPYLIADHANNGKMVWELMGLASDPGGFAELVGTTAGATTGSAGDVTVFLSTHNG
jgi:hypothetical protein